MKASDSFKTIINEHLKSVAAADSLFAVTFAKPGKNIDDCITYIMNTVKSSGCSGFADAEIFNMAIHYYDENDVKVGAKLSGKVVVNRTAEAFRESAGNAELKKPVKKAIKKSPPVLVEQTSLF
jgi:hypothetical protein